MYQTRAKMGIALIRHTIITPNTVTLALVLAHILPVVIMEALPDLISNILIALILSLLVAVWAIGIYFRHKDIVGDLVGDFRLTADLILNMVNPVPHFRHDIQLWTIRHD